MRAMEEIEVEDESHYRADERDHSWILDYMENDEKPEGEELLAMLDGLDRVEQILRRCDDVPMPEDARYYDRLHARITNAIREEDEGELRDAGLHAGKQLAAMTRSLRRS